MSKKVKELFPGFNEYRKEVKELYNRDVPEDGEKMIVNGIEYPVSPGFYNVPGEFQTLRCPICRGCRNEYIDLERDRLFCYKKGSLPDDLEHLYSFHCDDFEADPDSMDYELVMKEVNGEIEPRKPSDT